MLIPVNPTNERYFLKTITVSILIQIQNELIRLVMKFNKESLASDSVQSDVSRNSKVFSVGSESGPVLQSAIATNFSKSTPKVVL